MDDGLMDRCVVYGGTEEGDIVGQWYSVCGVMYSGIENGGIIGHWYCIVYC